MVKRHLDRIRISSFVETLLGLLCLVVVAVGAALVVRWQRHPPEGLPSGTSPDVPFESVDIDIAGAQTLGDAHAPVVIVEFADYECPFCGVYARDTFGTLASTYVGTGQVQYAFRHLPIDTIHPLAAQAAEAAECAGQQNRFWEMHHRLFENQTSLTSTELYTHAEAVDLDMTLFDRCLDGHACAVRVRAAVNAGLRAGVRGTPTFFIGTRLEGNRMRAHRKLVGAVPYATLQGAIDDLLRSETRSID